MSNSNVLRKKQPDGLGKKASKSQMKDTGKKAPAPGNLQRKLTADDISLPIQDGDRTVKFGPNLTPCPDGKHTKGNELDFGFIRVYTMVSSRIPGFSLKCSTLVCDPYTFTESPCVTFRVCDACLWIQCTVPGCKRRGKGNEEAWQRPRLVKIDGEGRQKNSKGFDLSEHFPEPVSHFSDDSD
ncbi:hypothetical protein BJ508DRAFT_314421 [Ascobolus immersus RN42]|uniref:Uncharacterized protein n=1 Tax=Ascobolus immersus RN42 TaxID=1160509 RepID=A0A3N4HIJ7_ASCIM|nr:hypothetical protein BJ508DRAFT_314421 [Ascobolus immersus RN42]